MCTVRGTQDSFSAVGINVADWPHSRLEDEGSDAESENDSDEDDGSVYEVCLFQSPEVADVPLPSSLELSSRLSVVQLPGETAAVAGAGASDNTDMFDGPFACSESCRAAAEKSGRVDMEPTGPFPEWAAAVQELILESGEMVGLLSVVLGRALDRWRGAGDAVTLEEVLHPLATLRSQPWSQATEESLDAITQCMAEHWRPRFQEEAARRDGVDNCSMVAELFSTEFLSKTLGSFELNAVGLEIPSPVRDYIGCLRRIAGKGGDAALAEQARSLLASIIGAAWRARAVRVLGGAPLGDDERILRVGIVANEASSDDESDDQPAATLGDVEALLASLVETDEADTALFPPIRGAAVFPGIAMANHSCNPNAEVRYSSGCGHPDVVSLRDIEAGEEVCISYCETSWALERRQHFLRQYGFVCRCDRCHVES